MWGKNAMRCLDLKLISIQQINLKLTSSHQKNLSIRLVATGIIKSWSTTDTGFNYYPYQDCFLLSLSSYADINVRLTVQITSNWEGEQDSVCNCQHLLASYLHPDGAAKKLVGSLHLCIRAVRKMQLWRLYIANQIELAWHAFFLDLWVAKKLVQSLHLCTSCKYIYIDT